MKDDYLFDGTGAPDPEVKDLEDLLSGLAYDGEAPEMPASRPQKPANSRTWFLVAIAAMTLIGVGAWTLQEKAPTGPSWSCGADCELFVGQWLETGADKALVEVADIGDMEVSPWSRLRLLATSEDEHRLQLDKGHIHASVYAPPRLLIVETPSATAVDLGCEYDLTVDDEGSGVLEVHSGWVSLELPDQVAVVPAGAKAFTRTGIGPGTPFFTDASVEMREALERFDFAGRAQSDLQIAITEARARDTLSLFHLVPRAEMADRQLLIDRMKVLTPWVAWQYIDDDAVAALDPEANDLLFDLLTTAW